MTGRNLYALGALLAAGLALGACGSAAEPSVASVGTSGSPAAADSHAQAAKYDDCLRKEGVKMLDAPGPDGQPQVDKEGTDYKVLEDAFEKCRAYAPAGTDATRAPAQDVEKARQYAACMREHGIAKYPDPDPVTGDLGISDALGAELKGDPAMPDAMQACAKVSQNGSGKGTVGG